MQNFINDISNNPIARLSLILLFLDVFLGSLKAIRELFYPKNIFLLLDKQKYLCYTNIKF